MATLRLQSGSLAGTRLGGAPATAARASRGSRLVVSASAFGPGKKWENTPLTANGKPVFQTVHVRTGDTVQVIAGSDKGKVGVVQKVLLKTGQVVVEGVNVKTKTVQPKSKDETGRLVQTESPIHSSNVMAYSKEKGVRSRIGYKTGADGKKVRVLVKTGEELPASTGGKKE